MIKRTLYFGNAAWLRCQNKQLVVEYKERENKSAPMEDIGLVIIDHPQVGITQGAANALLENKAAVLWCDQKHLPHGLLLPMYGHHAHTQKIRTQLEASAPLKKRLWQQCIQFKIRNQAAVLERFGFEVQNMRHWADKTGSGDPKNCEAKAAAYYWRCLLDKYDGITRGRFEGPPNHLLNYGYAVLRALIARCLVISGCLPALGIHHRNKYNPFCLADDMMEAYRPIVDQYIFEHLGDLAPQPDLTKDDKIMLLKIPVLDVDMGGTVRPLAVAAQHTSASLMQCFEGEKRKLALPQIK